MPPEDTADTPAKFPLWFSFLARLPLTVLYPVFGLICAAAYGLGYRRKSVLANLSGCFPELADEQVRVLAWRHYQQLGQVIAELIASTYWSRQQLLDRVVISNATLATRVFAQGKPVLLVGAHQANWEWVLQVLALRLGYPLDVGYKPIKNATVDKIMNQLRCRFGAHLVPAKALLADLLQRRTIVRGIAMLADQEPTTSEHKLWTEFLSRPTAFYVGPEQMARAARYPALFVAMRRISKGRYEIEFEPLATAEEKLAPGEFTSRYAACVEREIRRAPSDWTWGHRRWKLKPSVYAS
jgi:Kdo2-lipid IVA lauroyltransferase/acyltransferase